MIALLFACYLAIVVGVVVWMFEVKLTRLPAFVYAAPYTIRVGDNIDTIHLTERLASAGLTKTTTAIPQPGEWSQSGSGINIHFRYCPIAGEGIISGPVTLNMDWKLIKSIYLATSHADVSEITIEPQLLSVLHESEGAAELCRPVPLQKMPSLLIDAVLLTEDAHFFHHQGIDIPSVIEAVKTNIKARRYVQGGSTISQQLIRMTILHPEKTMGRKINEAFLALAADAIYSKERILSAYLNRVYLGHWGSLPIKGVAEAARHYFGKGLSALEPEECALLAAIIRAPNVITPYKHPERAHGRRNTILGLLLKEGKINREQYEEAINTPVRMRRMNTPGVKSAAFVDLIKPEAAKNLSTGRRDFVTSFDPLLQTAVEGAMKRYDDGNVSYHFILCDPNTGYIRAYLTGGPRWNGEGGAVDAFAPLALLPALTAEKGKPVKLALTSQVCLPDQTSGMLTLRRAFALDRESLLKDVVDRVGHDRITAYFREFGVRPADGEVFPTRGFTPIQMSETYATLANLGKRVSLSGLPHPGQTTAESVGRKTNLDPGPLFLVNYLLKNSDSLGDQAPADAVRNKPSTYIFRDQEGLWVVAYRRDLLMTWRLKNPKEKAARVTKVIDTFFPPLPDDVQAPPPDDIVFRKVCPYSGSRATSICPRVIVEPFIKGTQPQEWCTHSHDGESITSQAHKGRVNGNKPNKPPKTSTAAKPSSE